MNDYAAPLHSCKYRPVASTRPRSASVASDRLSGS